IRSMVKKAQTENRFKASNFKLVELLEDIPQNKFNLIFWHLVGTHVVIRVLDKVLSRFNTQDIARTRLKGRETPTTIVRRYVQHGLAVYNISIRLNQRPISFVEPIAGANDTGLIKAWICVEKTAPLIGFIVK